ncbi:18376_t:CDS:2 [Dentiscutata erythropus]|uniref:18376_t:CDS:1 n=1 Tax=Dentiscutata erythropus TaxID=1348616 RepID=A0A9N9FFW1_9GLOM|nr:18376_t:CDS:2 [Dentiscutata erythropus]
MTSTSTPPTSPKSINPLTDPPTLPKLRHIAPAPRDKPEYDIYHIPKGYEVVLVPKTSSNGTTDFSTGPTSPTSSVIPLSPAASVSSIHGSPSKLSLSPPSKSPPNSSWRKRKNNGHIPRPKNCFMAYREHMQHEVLKKNPGMNNKHVSVIAAEIDSAPSTPPSFIDDPSHSPPIFNSHHDNRSPSPLRFETLKVESNNLDHQNDWQRICDMPLEGELFQSLLPPPMMDFDQPIHVDAPYYDDFESGSFLQPDTQLLNPFEFNHVIPTNHHNHHQGYNTALY